MQPIIVTTTCESREDGELIARSVLEKRLSACVQISGPVLSSYWWEDKITSATEFLVVMKSERGLFEQLSDTIRAVHPYEVPEIIAVDITAIDTPYKQWLEAELNHGK
ncbi:MAG: divalent-cation tolerance protein CutA [Desulfocapsaceae bacterium]